MRLITMACVTVLCLSGCDAARYDHGTTNVPRNYAVDAPQDLGEEELIGAELLGTSGFFDTTTAGLKARYYLSISMVPDSAGGWNEYYLPTTDHHFGWFSTQTQDCREGRNEVHDKNGDGAPENTGAEADCIPNGEYVLRLLRVHWNASGSGWASPPDTLLMRRIAMLDRLGSLQHDPTSGGYHDVRVAFDLSPAATTLSGDIRAADYFREMSSEDSLYPLQTQFTITQGDTLWFISTYRAFGADGRYWNGERQYILNAFNTDYAQQPQLFGPAVNSVPAGGNATPSKPMLYRFDQIRSYVAVGKVIEPYHLRNDSGRVVGPNIYVTVDSSPPPPPPLTATISGPDLITATGTYEWHTAVSGGASPYHYRWFYYRSPGPEQPVGSDSPDYARYVSVKRTDAYIFRLTDSVSDGSAQKVRALYFVEVEGGGGGAAPLATERVRYLDGSCQPRPASGPPRQAWLTEFFLAGRAPRLCSEDIVP